MNVLIFLSTCILLYLKMLGLYLDLYTLIIGHKSYNLPESGIEPGTSGTQKLRVLIVVNPFNCFDAMGQNVNKQSQMCGPDIFNKYIFYTIFLHA